MQSMRFNLPVRRLFSALMAVCICALMFISTVSPAFAVSSNPTKGEDKLLGIERKSQEVTLSDPYSMEKTKTEANKGINEVQGDADLDKMINPENTTATSVEEQAKNFLEKIAGNDD